jgi:hypothetical protein
VGRATVGAVVFLLCLGLARADEAAARSALDDARVQLEKQQWDRCREALDRAAARIQELDGKARGAAQKEHDALLARCAAGEKAYPFRDSVAQARAALETARQDLALKNAQGAATDLEDARKAIAAIDAPTKERFLGEISELAKAVAAGELDARLERIDALLEGQETELAKKLPSVEALQVGAGLIDRELDKADPADPRTTARRERSQAQRAKIAALAGSARERVVVPVLQDASRIQSSKDAADATNARTPTLEEWRGAPRLSAFAGACERVIDAVEAWLASPALDAARRGFASDAELVATTTALRKLEDDARLHLCEVADGIVSLVGAVPDATTVAALAELRASLEKRARPCPRCEEVLSHARALGTRLGAPQGGGKGDGGAALRASALALWPAMVAAHGETAALGSDAIPADGSWSGKLVRLTGVSNRYGDPFARRLGPHLVATVNGGLVACVLDEGLWDALYRARLQTGLEPDPIHDLVARVQGRCRLDPQTCELVLDPARPATEAPLLRIVALDVGVFVFSVKKGTNVPGIDVAERGIPGLERRLAGRPDSSWEKWLSLGLAGLAVVAILGGLVSSIRLFLARKKSATMIIKRSGLRTASSAATPAAGRAPVTVTKINGVEVRKTFCGPCGGEQVVNEQGRCILCGAEVAESTVPRAPNPFVPILSGASGPSGGGIFGGTGPIFARVFVRVILMLAGLGVLATTGGRVGFGRHRGWARPSYSRPSYPPPYRPAVTPHGPGFDMPEYDSGGYDGGGDDEGD